MPELPEAETIVRSLRPLLEGRTIRNAEFLARRVSKDSPEALTALRIQSVSRYGKQIVFQFHTGQALLIKLGMTGALLATSDVTPYTRAIFMLDNGATLAFHDIRQFGSLTLLPAHPQHLGPDPLEISAAEFHQRLKSHKTQAKRLLLDQSFLRGIGNIYADEALFRAGIHPKARTNRFSVQRSAMLHAAIREVLEDAIAHRGSSISDYVDASGAKGSFQLRHRVYGREGEDCFTCASIIRRIVLAQRSSHYCPECQKN
jgi:formamidopyrimidine-DNA glycosylase